MSQYKFEKLLDIANELSSTSEELSHAFMVAKLKITELATALAILEKAAEGSCGYTVNDGLQAFGLGQARIWSLSTAPCPECGSNTLEYHITDGDFQDCHYRCRACPADFWVDGLDA